MTFFPFDDINALTEKLVEEQKQPDTDEKSKRVDKLLDEVEELLAMDYFYGVMDASQGIGRSLEPDIDEARAVINERYEDKNYRDRLSEYLYYGTPYDIERVIKTDAHRVYNAAIYTSAKKAGATKKTWRTMEDPRVRDSHDYLDRVTVDIDDEFYTYNGHHTYYPGQFGIAEEDINCRCWITIS